MISSLSSHFQTAVNYFELNTSYSKPTEPSSDNFVKKCVNNRFTPVTSLDKITAETIIGAQIFLVASVAAKLLLPSIMKITLITGSILIPAFIIISAITQLAKNAFASRPRPTPIHIEPPQHTYTNLSSRDYKKHQESYWIDQRLGELVSDVARAGMWLGVTCLLVNVSMPHRPTQYLANKVFYTIACAGTAYYSVKVTAITITGITILPFEIIFKDVSRFFKTT